MKKLTIFLAVFIMSLCMAAQSVKTVKHEVQSGETLSSIARTYNISLSKLKEFNPNLNPDFIMAGQKINVPATKPVSSASNASQTVKPVETKPVQQTQAVEPAQTSQPAQTVQQTTNRPYTFERVDQAFQQQTQTAQVEENRPKYKTTHEVKKKETIYSISHTYGITEQQLIDANPEIAKGSLKKGKILNIPYTVEEDLLYQAELEKKRLAEEEARKPKVTMYNTIKAAIILPFNLSEETMTSESQKMANLYQGFLLGVDSLKQRGYSVDVMAFDEGYSVDNILNNPDLKDVQLIVGPARQSHIAAVADFAHKNNILHVVPLSNDLSIVNEHPTMFQVNISSSAIYSQVYNRFIAMHKDDNIIFVGMNDKNDNVNYITEFKKALESFNIKYNRVSISEFSTIKDILATGKRNVIITSSGSASAFESLCSKLNSLQLGSDCVVQLFGFPEWQTLKAKHQDNINKYRCQFFTTFYSNSQTYRNQQFNNRFNSWFKQEQYNSFPRYGELGYDISCFFLKGLKEYGSGIYQNIHNFSYNSLEFPMNFEKKNDWSGYQNKSLMIVTHTTDGKVNVR